MTEHDTAPELGLKERNQNELFDELMAQKWAPEEERRLTAAYELVATLHAGDTHRDKPYTYHLLRIANRAVQYLEFHDADLAAACLLHDSVEDHAGALLQALMPDAPVPKDSLEQQKAAFDAIARRFSPATAAIVEGMTNPPGLMNAPTFVERVEQYVEHVVAAIEDLPVAFGKFCDWVDNGVGIIHSTDASPEELARFRYKYGQVIDAFEERLSRPDALAVLSAKAQDYIKQQLDLGRERLITPEESTAL